MKIAFLSDFHVGSHSGDPGRMEAVVEAVLGMEPDLVLLGGDFVNMMPGFGGRVPPRRIAEILGRLGAPLGVWAVLGNHDWEYGERAIIGALDAEGISVLQNRTVTLMHHGVRIHLSGVDDYATRRGSLSRTLRNVPENEPLLILSHDPAAILDLGDRPALMLAGHTHGGQVVLPFFGPVVNASVVPLALTYGHTDVENGRQLIVSSGLGTSGLPLRIGTWPEIVEIALVS